MNTSERRKKYTAEQIDAERQYRLKYQAENKEMLAKKAAERRAAGKAKPTSYYRQRATSEQRQAELAQKRKHYQETKEQQLSYAAKYREENKERLLVEWREQNKNRKQYHDEWNLKNADKRRLQRTAWTAENAQCIKAQNAAWRRDNADLHRAHQHARRARKKESGGVLSSDIVQRLMTAQRGRCVCCGKLLGNSYEIDHIIPIVKGGTNTDDNVQLLKPRCNRQKGASDPISFMQRRGRLL